MRWIPFLILLYLASALQIAHLGQLGATAEFQPQYLPLLSIFYAMYAPEDQALLAAFLCGLLVDLLGAGPPGRHALVLTACAWVVVKIRSAVFRESALSQAFIVFFGVGGFLFFSQFVPATLGYGGLGGRTGWRGFSIVLSDAAITAVLGPIMFRLLLRLRGMLGMEDRRARTFTHN